MTKEKAKKFGLWSIVLLGFNSIIGSGIFLLPSALYKFAGNWSVAIVFITGLIVSTIALCFAEAAGKFTKNGAAYVYTREAFGDFAGFEVGFLKWVMQCVAWGVMAVALTDIVSTTCGFNDNIVAKQIMIVSIITVLTVVNLFGVNAAKIVNNISTFAKIIPLLFLIVVGIWYINPSFIIPTLNHATVDATQPVYALSFSTLGAALILCFYSFTGFETFGTAAEDMEDPKKNLPKAICLIMGIVIIFYAIVMAVTIGILGPNVTNSLTPLADAARVISGDFGYWLISIGSIISIIGINIAASFHIPRALLPLSDDKMVPKYFGLKNKKGVPYIAIIASAIVTVPIALSGSFSTLAMLSVVARFAQYIPTCISVLIFRKKFANQEKSFTAPFGPILPITGVVICLWLLSQQDLTKILFGLAAMVLIAPLYIWAQKKAKLEQVHIQTHA